MKKVIFIFLVILLISNNRSYSTTALGNVIFETTQDLINSGSYRHVGIAQEFATNTIVLAFEPDLGGWIIGRITGQKKERFYYAKFYEWEIQINPEGDKRYFLTSNIVIPII